MRSVIVPRSRSGWSRWSIIYNLNEKIEIAAIDKATCSASREISICLKVNIINFDEANFTEIFWTALKLRQTEMKQKWNKSAKLYSGTIYSAVMVCLIFTWVNNSKAGEIFFFIRYLTVLIIFSILFLPNSDLQQIRHQTETSLN